ncbi:hypothetical protein [Streptomyces sp. CAU 1734]|uniref:hypothetical protein n=1 Tax=Streptomyces sp. CAU 1734 TaxID=3140360 RepID=UPI0032608236
MAQRTEYDERQAAKRLYVPVASFRWARHTKLIPAPDASGQRWSRTAVEAMNAKAIRASLPAPISGAAAADRIAEALGTPHSRGDRRVVSSFVIRRLIDLKLLTELSANPDGSLVNPDQVDAVCARGDLAELVENNQPLGPEQAAQRLSVRRADFDHMVRLGGSGRPTRSRSGSARPGAGAVDVALYRAGDIDALPAGHPEVDWGSLRAVGKGQRSPLALLSAVTA